MKRYSTLRLGIVIFALAFISVGVVLFSNRPIETTLVEAILPKPDQAAAISCST